VRVERDGESRLLVRYEPPPGGAPAAFARAAGIGLPQPLVPAADGLLAVEVGGRGEWAEISDAEGRTLATVGLDTPAPAEYRDPPPADVGAIAALVASPAERAATPLAPWLAAAAAGLALAAVAASRIKSPPRLAR
jgi:hypothetical protein